MSNTQEHTQPEYVDVAASSLKAMIDPDLESSTLNLESTEPMHMPHAPIYTHNIRLDANGKVVVVMDGENLDETIMRALRNTDEQVKSMQ